MSTPTTTRVRRLPARGPRDPRGPRARQHEGVLRRQPRHVRVCAAGAGEGVRRGARRAAARARVTGHPRRAARQRLDPADQPRHALQRRQAAIQGPHGHLAVGGGGPEPGAARLLRPAAAGDRHRRRRDAPVRAAGARGLPPRGGRRAVGGGEAYRRVPQGFATDHPRADLLRHNALYVSGEWDLPPAVSGPGFVLWVADRLEHMASVERWLTKVLDAASL
jgi:hypothetical protein